MSVQLQFLGLPRVCNDGRVSAIAWQRQSLTLLTYLFTAAGPQARDDIAFAIWPDADEEAARTLLRRNLNQLRGVLPAPVVDWIVAEPGSIEFRHDVADTDVAEFEAAARSGDYERSVRVYQGDFAASSSEPWVLTTRERLRARFHWALGELVRIDFSARRFESALAHARRISHDEPFREDIVRRTIAIRYAMGDRPGALAEYDRFAASLRAELNIEPMAETVWLRELIVRGDDLPFAPDSQTPAYRIDNAAPAATALLPFTGRRTALAGLRGAWDEACSGRGSLIVVRGEAGIGKTRLIAEFLEHAVGMSGRILRGTTASPEARPYEALLAAFGQAAPFVSALDLEAVWLAGIAVLAPEIGARVGPLRAPAPLAPEREVARLLESFARFAGGVARGRPTVIVLEDLHWAGAASLAALRHLALRLRGHRVLMVVSSRTGDESGLGELERELCGSGHARTISLARLKTPEVVDLLVRTEPPVTGHAAADLAERSEGHPLFLCELLREDRSGQGGVSGGIAEIVGARLARAAPDTVMLARTAAVCGATFDLDMLLQATGWDESPLVDRLAELLAHQFVRSTAAHERGSYAFGHALVHSAVLATVPERERRRIHRITARVLESRHAGLLYDREIARHWEAAGDERLAAQAYLRAAHAASAARAPDEAATFAARGLALTEDRALRRTLLHLRIAANMGRTSLDVQRSDVERLRALAAELDEDARFDAELLACRVEESSGDIATRVPCADRLRAFADTGSALRAAEIASIDGHIAFSQGRFTEAIALARLAAQSFMKVGRTRDALRESILTAKLLMRLGNLDEALAQLIAIESDVVSLDDSRLAIDYWIARSTIPMAREDPSEILRVAHRLNDAARAAGDRLAEAASALTYAAAYHYSAAHSHALRQLDRAAEIYAAAGASRELRTVQINRAATFADLGRLAESIDVYRALYKDSKAADSDEDVFYVASAMVTTLLGAGIVDEALILGHEALALARSMGGDLFAATALGNLGEAEIAAGRTGDGLAHLLESAAINRSIERPAEVAGDLARAAAAEPVPEHGAAHARAALAIVEGDPTRTVALEVLSRCASAFERAGDTSAAEYCLGRGRALFAIRLAALDPEDRASYSALTRHRPYVELDEPATTVSSRA